MSRRQSLDELIAEEERDRLARAQAFEEWKMVLLTESAVIVDLSEDQERWLYEKEPDASKAAIILMAVVTMAKLRADAEAGGHNALAML